ncbi:MAG: hypothetical protein LBF08_08165 [Dysgonamonadaceae bacterium]|jgi:hypothetical protein|nr:hypothetical protein [Dysgonamonadaceae bacterium]
MLVQESEIREVYGITEEQKQRIMDFLRGAVYCWCKNRKDEWFAARDLLGGDNFYWQGTPMLALYEKSEDVEQAGKDAGWLLKRVINNDKRRFETTKKDFVRQYRWTGEEENDL